MCREAWGGVCVRHAEENKTDKTSARVIKVGAQGNTCEEATSGTAGKCLTSHCDVTIGGNSYCSQCSKPSDHLVDGKCVAASGDTNNNCVNTNNQGTCTQCDGQSFMYQGGCYQTGNQNPGNTLCTAAANGICTQAAEGYFVPPGATADKQSVVKCDDIAGVTIGNNNGAYKGIANCVTCTAPQTNSAGGTATCTVCVDGKYGDTCATDCDANCKACKDTATQCTSCKSSGNNQYFKEGTNGDGTGTCVAEGGCATHTFQ